MPDLSEFDAIEKPAKPCRVATELVNLTADDREKAEAALLSYHSSGTIEKWFAGRGIQLGARSIGHHRQGRCSCG